MTYSVSKAEVANKLMCFVGQGREDKLAMRTGERTRGVTFTTGINWNTARGVIPPGG